MTPFVPIMLFGWVPFTIFLFFKYPPHKAVLISLIGGWLLLPPASYDLPGIPMYDKYVAISLGLILGGRLSGQRLHASFKWKIYDLPMVLWCFSQVPSSLLNNLGFYDGFSGAFSTVMTWGIPYLAGRIYFKNPEALQDLCYGIIIGGIFYSLLCWYEIRMSPRLNIDIYGFFQHDWRQHKRYGGWRPIVFMQHGLMVAVWMAASSSTAFWLWRKRIITQIKNISMGLITAVLVITTLFCKSASGWVALMLGIGGYFICHRLRSYSYIFLLLLVVPIYITLRLSGLVHSKDVEMIGGIFFDVERTASLSVRLEQENLFVAKAMEQLWFGWGQSSRAWPIDAYSGKSLIRMWDSLWIIVFSLNGLIGVITWVTGMLIGPWFFLQRSKKMNGIQNQKPVIIGAVLSLLVVIFMIDSLFNGMINPIYIMVTGALSSFYSNKI